MQIVETNTALKEVVRRARGVGQTIGFVPTMGYLHEGHLSLMRRARLDNDLVVASIFVNPTQFGPKEDLEAYPRNAQRDMDLMKAEKVDLAFFPSVEELYPPGYTTFVEMEGLMTRVLCGTSRPIHFRGVATIVAKLFNLVCPDRAYFGQKDAQQVAVIRQMVRDLDFDLEVVVCSTVREADGLAMSSRNAYLTPEQRADAVVISQSLTEVQEQIGRGERNAATIIKMMTERINSKPEAAIDYIAVVDAQTLGQVETLKGEIIIAVAVQFGKSRLIDNIQIKV